MQVGSLRNDPERLTCMSAPSKTNPSGCRQAERCGAPVAGLLGDLVVQQAEVRQLGQRAQRVQVLRGRAAASLRRHRGGAWRPDPAGAQSRLACNACALRWSAARRPPPQPRKPFGQLETLMSHTGERQWARASDTRVVHKPACWPPARTTVSPGPRKIMHAATPVAGKRACRFFNLLFVRIKTSRLGIDSAASPHTRQCLHMSAVSNTRTGAPAAQRRAFELPRNARHAVVAEQQRFQARQLREALQDDDSVVRQVHAVKLVLRRAQVLYRVHLGACGRRNRPVSLTNKVSHRHVPQLTAAEQRWLGQPQWPVAQAGVRVAVAHKQPLLGAGHACPASGCWDQRHSLNQLRALQIHTMRSRWQACAPFHPNKQAGPQTTQL